MRTGDKVSVGVAATAAFAVFVFMICASNSDRRLAASLQRFEQVKAASAKASARPLIGEPFSKTTPDSVTAQDKLAGPAASRWEDLFAHITKWLESIPYPSASLLFPGELKYASDKSLFPPLSPPPDGLLAEIRSVVSAGPVPVPLSTDVNLFNCAVLLAGEAQRELDSGGQTAAIRDIVLAMKIADMTMQSPSIEQQYQQRRIYGALQNVIQPTELKLDIVRPLIEYISAAKGKVDMQALLADDLQQRLSETQKWRNESYTDWVKDSGLYWGTRNWLWVSPLCKPLFDHDQQTYVEMTTQLVESAEMPLYETKQILDTVEAEADVSQNAFWNENESWHVRHRLNALVDHTDFESRLDIMRLGIALNAYCGRESKIAESLDVIYGDLGGAPPVDPFTGNPYHYDVRPTGFMVYSEGRKNDGAGPAWAHSIGK